MRRIANYFTGRFASKALPLLLLAMIAGMVFPQPAAAQSGSDLEPPQNVQKNEGDTVTFGVTVEDVALADIISVKIMAESNSGVPIAGLNGANMAHVGTVAAGERYEHQYTIPLDFLETYLHQNLKWYIQVTYNGGTFTAPGSGQHVIHVREAPPPIGTLEVITQVTGGGSLPIGAGWSLSTQPAGYSGTTSQTYNGGETSPQTFTNSAAETGDYAVSANSVSGYSVTVSPNSAQTLNDGGTVTFTVTYTRQTGTLNVITEVTGGGNIPAGGGWDLTTTPGDFGGSPTTKTYNGSVASGDSVNITPAVTGSYGITGKVVAGYTISYGPQSGSLSSGGSLTLKVIYTRQTGTLIVTIDQGGSSGSYSISGPSDFTPLSGQTSNFNSTVPIGNYTVTFTNEAGYILTVSGDFGSSNPASGSVGVGETKQVHGVYTEAPQVGTLNVNIDPENIGASFTITGPSNFNGGNPLTSGTDFSSNVPAGAYTVTFTNEAGYTLAVSGDFGTSNPASGSIADGETKTVNGVYTRATGTLIVTIDQGGSSGSYSISGPADFTPLSGQTGNFNSAVPTGNYTVTFTNQTGYSLNVSGDFGTSNPASGSVGAGETKQVHGVYAALPGSLRVFLVPTAQLAGAGGWRLVGDTTWLAHNDVMTGMAPGFYTIEFRNAAGWIKPGNQTVQVFAGLETQATGIYRREGELSGALQVFIEDNQHDFVLLEGAQWRPRFSPESGIPNTPTWYDDGDIIYDLPVGPIGIEFKVIPGWILPDLTGGFIKANTINQYTGEYIRPLIIHKADYNGDGTDDLATFDENKGRWLVASISKPDKKKPKSSPPAFQFLKRKFGKMYDIPAPGDYDGDGIADLAYYRESNGEWNVKKQFKIPDFGLERDIPVPGDYNGDGRTDPALFRPTTGDWLIYDVDNEKIIQFKFGVPGDVPVPGNYNGDKKGMTDPAIYNVVSGEWRVAIYNAKKDKWVERKKIKVKGVGKVKLRLNYGEIGDIPIHADYDGNGLTDHAFYRRNGSKWFVLDQFEELELGVRGDIPIPNDWAGLGRVIPAMFRVKDGNWFAIDDLLNTKHGKGGMPLMSGR